MQKLDELMKVIQAVSPKCNYKFKTESRLMKFIGKLMFFNKAFMTGYTTTLGYTTYFPSKEWAQANDPWFVLAHEFVHMKDHDKNKAFGLLYSLPQTLFVFALTSLLSIWFSKFWLFSLLFLVFLAPIPAYFRMKYEMRGYAMNMAIRYWMTGLYDYSPIERFASADYYFMWAFKKDLNKKFNDIREKIKSRKVLEELPYKLIHDWMLDNGMVKF